MKRKALGSVSRALGEEWSWWRGWPPTSMFRSSGDHGSIKEALAITAPHWDGAVELVGPSGKGYSEALRLLNRLDEEVGAWETSQEETESMYLDAHHLAHVMLREGYGLDYQAVGFVSRRAVEEDAVGASAVAEDHGDGYGPENTLAESLGWPEISPGARDRFAEWRWVAVPEDRYGPDRYALVLPSSGDDGLPPRRLEAAPALLTWKRALLRWLDRIEGMKPKVGKPTPPELEVVRFRRDVLADVVRMFELTGSVIPLGALVSPEDTELTPEDELILTVAYDAISDTAITFTSKTRVIKDVVQKLQDRGSAKSQDKVIRALRKIGAYKTSGPKGSSTPALAKKELADLIEVVQGHNERITKKE